MTATTPLGSLLAALSDGEVDLVDLTQPLSEGTPVMRVPEPFVNTRGLRMREISHYDERGPRWRWHDLELGEHVGTHLDAPIHWVSGQGGEDVAGVPLRRLVGPAVVIDKSAEAAADPDYLLTKEELQDFAREHGPLPDGGWLLYRTGWDARAHDVALFLNNASGRPRTPGIAPECARWLAQETGIVGVGVETVGTDAGASPTFDPPTPVHYYMLGAGKYGVTSLTNLDRLPPRGAVVIVAPLRLVGGTGSPARVMALVPRAAGGPRRD
ncbi:cyclase [Sphaerisporangium siamense]|uniref:Kynurenine formamidase n=1 Tax=Sphaerisporangium siamense TaxID=795645 RepID=A0A7W7DAU7_9ACTN|nr:cyclase family protein [Sphaerisporangium siamense]MBB4703457.1 kynurenine formamidase [Sphaerisporangium siamense]GII87549.1 cyclase [Sphaerisporangium siamense]